MARRSPSASPSPSPRLAVAAALLLSLGTSGCDEPEAAFAEQTLADESLDAPEAFTAPTRIEDGDGFILSTALVPPEQRVRAVGPATLTYVGPHRYVIPTDELVEEPAAEAAEVPAKPAHDIRLIDEQGHEWSISGFDSEAARAYADAYRAGLGELRELAAHDGHTNRGDVDDLAAPRDPQAASNWTEFDCGFSTKWRFDNGSMTDLDAVNDSQRRPVIDTNGTGFNGTAVLITDDLALTAGHVASALVAGDSMCRRFGTSGTECRDVSLLVVSGNGGGNDDWGLIRFESSFTGGWNFNLSDHTDGQINDHTPRIAAYPTLRMNEEASCGTSALLEGERNLGNYHSLLSLEARVDLTAGGGSSGAPYYLYEDGEYWVFGVHSYRSQTTLGNRYAAGPKVPGWLPEIVFSALTVGVVL